MAGELGNENELEQLGSWDLTFTATLEKLKHADTSSGSVSGFGMELQFARNIPPRAFASKTSQY